MKRAGHLCLKTFRYSGGGLRFQFQLQLWKSFPHLNRVCLQSEPGCSRHLHPPQGDRCEVCCDAIESDTHVRYCTIECWMRGETVVSFPTWWVADLVYEDYEANQWFHVDAFCVDYHCFFLQSNSSHINHKWIAIEIDPQDNSSCILIPSAHFLEEAFQGIKVYCYQCFFSLFRNNLFSMSDLFRLVCLTS
jgi:hypothetical protein